MTTPEPSDEGGRSKLLVGVCVAALAAAGVWLYRSKLAGSGFRPESTFASPYNVEKAEFRKKSQLHDLYTTMKEEIDLHGPMPGQISKLVDLISRNYERWVPVVLSFDGHVLVFKLFGNYDPELRQDELKEEDYEYIAEIVSFAAALARTKEGLEALMRTHFVATDLMHALFHSSPESQREILAILTRMCRAGAEGVATVLQSVEYFMYIDYEEVPLEKLVKSLATRTANEGLVEAMQLLLALANAEQPQDLSAPCKSAILAGSGLREALVAVAGRGDLLEREATLALVSDLNNALNAATSASFVEGRRVIDPKDEVKRYERKVHRWNRFSAGMWAATPAAFPAGIQKYSAEQQDKALQRVRNLSREARFADGLRKRDINREIAAVCGGVDQEFFKGMLHASGMFEATREFIDTALKYDNNLTDDDIHKAGRNFWTCLSLQLLLCGNEVNYQQSIYAYSMLYPYTDDYIDNNDVPPEDKKKFNAKFRHWLAGTGNEQPSNALEEKVRHMVTLIEEYWDREKYPGVYGSLLAIQDAQTASMRLHGGIASAEEIFEGAFDKGGTSVMADAWLVAGDLTDKQSGFAFNFGVALQILDDVQDVRRDVRDNQDTMCTLAFKQNHPEEFEILTRRLLNFLFVLINPESNGITDKESDDYAMRKSMVNMCYSIVLKAIAKDSYLFTENFAKEIEWYSPLPFSSMKKIVMIKKLMTLVRKDQI